MIVLTLIFDVTTDQQYDQKEIECHVVKERETLHTLHQQYEWKYLLVFFFCWKAFCKNTINLINVRVTALFVLIELYLFINVYSSKKLHIFIDGYPVQFTLFFFFFLLSH